MLFLSPFTYILSNDIKSYMEGKKVGKGHEDGTSFPGIE